jgi:hypothetical protein
MPTTLAALRELTFSIKLVAQRDTDFNVKHLALGLYFP